VKSGFIKPAVPQPRPAVGVAGRQDKIRPNAKILGICTPTKKSRGLRPRLFFVGVVLKIDFARAGRAQNHS
jgi:hypothetical protein